MDVIRVISDKFKNLADNNAILTFTQIQESNKTIDSPKMISLEQGLSEEQTKILKSTLKTNENIIGVKSYFDQYKRCDSAYTHKAVEYNTLISDPVQESDSHYLSLLMVDERCAELSDHVTGKHLQFMVLIEAARQMVNAVTEKYYSNSSKIFLANDLDIQFKEFVYPFETKIKYEVEMSKVLDGGNGKMKAKIDFVQNDKIKCSVFFTFTILCRNFVDTIEQSAIKSNYIAQ